MTGYWLLMAHLVGDYVAQNDWMAQNKTTQSWPCLVHCFFYTLAVATGAALQLYPMQWHGLLLVFATHFPMDRFRLARKWMTLNGQESFATGVFAPWSIIVVDNIIHLVILGVACEIP